MCKYIHSFETKTKFVLLMHPKEFKKTKNNTGRFTHLTLKNSEIIVGEDFSNNPRVNYLLGEFNCYILYPAQNSINLNRQSLPTKDLNLIFIVDSTWACAKKILRLSSNLQEIPKISFTHTKTSNYTIKEQPALYCLSTIESTQTLLEILIKQELEEISTADIENFLLPFHKMIDYQIDKINVNCVNYFTKNIKKL